MSCKYAQNGALQVVRIQNTAVRECLAEILGTFFLIAIGEAANASYMFGRISADANVVAWGLAVFISSCAIINVSGAHMNGAVTVTLALMGRFPWRKVPQYLLSQLIGAFLGGAFTYLSYWEPLRSLDFPLSVPKFDDWEHPERNPTASIFSTYPVDIQHSTMTTWIIMEACADILFLIVVLWATDPVFGAMTPLYVRVPSLALTVTAVLLSYSGTALNPSRDLGPRLFSAIVYGAEVFTALDYYFLVPLLVPFLGGMIAAVIYHAFIGLHKPKTTF